MKKSQLKQIIKEELENVLLERDWSSAPGVVGRGLTAMAGKGREKLSTLVAGATGLYKQYKDQSRQGIQSKEMQEWLPLLFGYPGFEEAAKRQSNAPSDKEFKELERETSRSRQTPGKIGYKENLAKLRAFRAEMTSSAMKLRDILDAAFKEHPGLEDFVVKAGFGDISHTSYTPGPAMRAQAALKLSQGESELQESTNIKLTKSQLKQIIKEELKKIGN
jgi:hypothetical protein